MGAQPARADDGASQLLGAKRSAGPDRPDRSAARSGAGPGDRARLRPGGRSAAAGGAGASSLAHCPSLATGAGSGGSSASGYGANRWRDNWSRTKGPVCGCLDSRGPTFGAGDPSDQSFRRICFRRICVRTTCLRIPLFSGRCFAKPRCAASANRSDRAGDRTAEGDAPPEIPASTRAVTAIACLGVDPSSGSGSATGCSPGRGPALASQG